MPEVTIQHLSSILRVHPTGVQWGGEWYWSCVLHWDSPTTVILLAAEKAPEDKADVEAIFAKLRDVGATTIMWDRRRPSGEVHRAILKADRRFTKIEHDLLKG